jgi:tRNA pseudouridine38-40 synthase
MDLSRYVVKFAFDGADFEGYARQPSTRTVEGELIDALISAKLIDDVKGAQFASSSRVDRGVSSLGAAFAFTTVAKQGRVLRSIDANARSIVAHSIARVPLGFDPRRRADRRWYRYHFSESDLPDGLDLTLMKEGSRLFIGEHDFSAFARVDRRNPMRVVERISMERQARGLILDIWGRSFLWNQVRRMASALHSVGSKELDPVVIERTLAGDTDWSSRPAPPEGLFLMDVMYDDLEFRSLTELPKGTRSMLAREYHDRRCGVRYMDYLREIVEF